MFIPLNEASLNYPQYSSENDNLSIFEDFFYLIQECINSNIIDKLIVDNRTDFYSNPYIQSWLSNRNISVEKKNLFRRFLDKYTERVNYENDSNSYTTINGQKIASVGADIAITVYNKNIINFSSSYRWKQDSLIYTQERIIEDRVDSTNYTLQQFSSKTQIEVLYGVSQSDLFNRITSPQDLWDNWNMFFPNLVPCSNILKCLTLFPQKSQLCIILEKLLVLQNYFKEINGSYNENDLKSMGLSVSTESDTVKNTPKYSKDRKFKLPDSGNTVFFFDHIKFNGYIPMRIHFLPSQTDTHFCYIGYIGKHLPIPSYC